ncbi:MAG: serine/threonine protein kinase [Alphaproteobacteria bacterium]
MSIEQSSIINFADRYEILPDQPAFLSPCIGGRAYKARLISDKTSEFIAVVNTMSPLVRGDILMYMRGMEATHLITPLEWGVCFWPAENANRFITIFPLPIGQIPFPDLNEQRTPINEEDLIQGLFNPAIHVLRALAIKGIFHGNINPSNIYVKQGAAFSVSFGECVTAPPGFCQPVIAETIERGMAEPYGKGVGSMADDLYSLGVTALFLLLGYNPLKSLTDEQIIETKIDKGSYAAFIGRVRISSGILEALRGLLTDDVRQRWTLEELAMWVSGRRPAAKSPMASRRAQRGFEFNGQEYWRVRTLSIAMSKRIPEAIAAIESGNLLKWLRRSLADKLCADRVEEAIKNVNQMGRSSGYEDRLVSRVCMGLDPHAPIRYKGISVLPDGLGYLLASHVIGRKNLAPISEIILDQLPLFWFSLQGETKKEFMNKVAVFDGFTSTLMRSTFSFGIERCLYEMLADMPCASDGLRDFYLTSSADLLIALEQIASKPENRPKAPIDRHVAAFLAARDRRVSELLLSAVGTADGEGARNLAMLSVLANIQRRADLSDMPNLGAWCADLLLPFVKKFHNRDLQGKIQKVLMDSSKTGNLSGMLKLIDNPQIIEEDQRLFQKARRNYAVLEQQRRILQVDASTREELESGLGAQLAALVAGVLGIAISTTIVISRMREVFETGFKNTLPF